jgi:hypothetical protein
MFIKMGCRQSLTSYERKSPENDKVDRFEDSLGLKQNDCCFYEGVLSRLSNSSLSAAQSLNSFFKFSKLSPPSSLHSSLLTTFASGDKLDLTALRCFCILYSRSPELEKGEALWYSFDTGMNDHLASTAIKQLLGNLIRSAVSVTLGPAMKSENCDEKKIQAWETYLKERIESLEVKLLKHFTQGKEMVSKEEFILRLQDRPEGLITTAAAIRGQLERTQVIPNKFANPFKHMRVTKLTG